MGGPLLLLRRQYWGVRCRQPATVAVQLRRGTRGLCAPPSTVASAQQQQQQQQQLLHPLSAARGRGQLPPASKPEWLPHDPGVLRAMSRPGSKAPGARAHVLLRHPAAPPLISSCRCGGSAEEPGPAAIRACPVCRCVACARAEWCPWSSVERTGMCRLRWQRKPWPRRSTSASRWLACVCVCVCVCVCTPGGGGEIVSRGIRWLGYVTHADSRTAQRLLLQPHIPRRGGRR
jgi:hypothetical protein